MPEIDLNEILLFLLTILHASAAFTLVRIYRKLDKHDDRITANEKAVVELRVRQQLTNESFYRDLIKLTDTVDRLAREVDRMNHPPAA